MTRPHLRQSDGGNPAQGPVRELANEPPSPKDANEFPDAPDASDASGGSGHGTQDKPDLDAFAAALGTDRLGDDERPEPGDELGSDAPLWKRVVARGLRTVGSGAGKVSSGLDSAADRIAP